MTLPSLSSEIVLSKDKAEELTSSFELPKTERKIRKSIAPFIYRHILCDPSLDNEKIKKIVEESLLNDWLRMCYGKGISIINSKFTT